jgi:hypothetical protein
MIPSSAIFDQSTVERLLEYDPLVQDHRRFFALFDGDLVDQWQALRCGPGRPGNPLHAYLKACVLRRREGLIYSSHLRRFLLNHPLLVIELGLRLEPDPAQPYGFDLDKTVPCEYWLRQQLHRCDHELLQALLKATVVALKEEIPGLGETVALDVKHMYAWVHENNPRIYVKGRYDVTHHPQGDPDGRLGVKKSSLMAPRKQRRKVSSAPAPGSRRPIPFKYVH